MSLQLTERAAQNATDLQDGLKAHRAHVNEIIRTWRDGATLIRRSERRYRCDTSVISLFVIASANSSKLTMCTTNAPGPPATLSR
jgi:hypothetical protein